ncbi:hypothetical protein [Streptomyces laculatispora]|uniref:hypothetical protein n=1 Tax=Streptomyces laculatispora TaxID=887464 RepID=UPI001F5FB6D2|nr:hypothetical protein [Streptomyces laculatispora]
MANGSATRREQLADRPELSPPAVLEGQATIFEIERDWRPLAGALLPTPLPPVKALLADFARYTSENRWNQKVHEPSARVLRVAAIWLGAETVFLEDEVRAPHRVFGGTGRIRGLVAFLDQRQQLVPSPPRRKSGEAFVQRTIAALPPRISDELGTWVGVLRGTSRSHHCVTDYATLRRYLIYLATPLADWTTRYTTLRQVTEADVTAAVTAVKGPRAHERAVGSPVALSSPETHQARLRRPHPWPPHHPSGNPADNPGPDRLAGLLETSSNPATRLVLSLVALHATSGTDLRNLVLYVCRRFDPAGLTLRAVRADRIMDEALETEDPVHLVHVFGISITTAMKYIHTAHPHRGGPVPR